MFKKGLFWPKISLNPSRGRQIINRQTSCQLPFISRLSQMFSGFPSFPATSVIFHKLFIIFPHFPSSTSRHLPSSPVISRQLPVLSPSSSYVFGFPLISRHFLQVLVNSRHFLPFPVISRHFPCEKNISTRPCGLAGRKG